MSMWWSSRPIVFLPRSRRSRPERPISSSFRVVPLVVSGRRAFPAPGGADGVDPTCGVSRVQPLVAESQRLRRGPGLADSGVPLSGPHGPAIPDQCEAFRSFGPAGTRFARSRRTAQAAARVLPTGTECAPLPSPPPPLPRAGEGSGYWTAPLPPAGEGSNCWKVACVAPQR
jgi:hypothetical protein